MNRHYLHRLALSSTLIGWWVLSAQEPAPAGLYQVESVAAATSTQPAFHVFSGERQELSFSVVAPFSGEAKWAVESFQKSGNTLMPLPGVVLEGQPLTLLEGRLYEVSLSLSFPETRGPIEVFLRLALDDEKGMRHFQKPSFLMTVYPPQETMMKDLKVLLGFDEKREDPPVKWFGDPESAFLVLLEGWGLEVKDPAVEGEELLAEKGIWFGEFYPEDREELLKKVSASPRKPTLIVCWDASDSSSVQIHLFSQREKVLWSLSRPPVATDPNFLTAFTAQLRYALPSQEPSL